MKLSIVMPVYNEQGTLREVVARVLAVPLEIELICVDDASRDGSREILQSIPIEEDRFGFEPEITVKIAKRRLRVYEVGISYWGRTYEEGKKIGWKDGLRALWCLLKYTVK